MSQETEKRYLGSVEDRRRRFKNIMMLGPGILGLLIIAIWIVAPIELLRVGAAVALVPLTAAIMIFSSAFFLLLRYFQRGYLIEGPGAEARTSAHEPMLDPQLRGMAAKEHHEINELRLELTDLRESLSRLLSSTEVLTDERQEELANAVRDKIESEAAQEILNKIQLQVSASMNTDSQLRDLSRQASSTVARLENEVSALTRRGNLNLVLGIMTTVAGLAVLAYAVFAAEDLGNDPWVVTAYYLPRLSLVTFIEVFAYFFLRLYRSSLIYIKYFQNEVTNVETKYIAVRVALGSNDEKIQGEVVVTLAKTERNFVLEKGQTTVDLEKERIDRQTVRDSMKVLSEAAKNLVSRR